MRYASVVVEYAQGASAKTANGRATKQNGIPPTLPEGEAKKGGNLLPVALLESR